MKKAEDREHVICPLARQLVLISLSLESKLNQTERSEGHSM